MWSSYSRGISITCSFFCVCVCVLSLNEAKNNKAIDDICGNLRDAAVFKRLSALGIIFFDKAKKCIWSGNWAQTDGQIYEQRWQYPLHTPLEHI